MKRVLYDYLQVAGGAERVSLILAQALPGYQLVVSRTYAQAQPLLTQQRASVLALGNRYTRWLTRIPEAIFNFWFRANALKLAQVVVYSGFYAPLAVRHQKEGLRVYYCHTLPRYAYDLYAASRAAMPWAVRWAFDLFVVALRWQYSKAINKMDVVLVNSDNVRKRLKNYLNIDARVLYPPVETGHFKWRGDDGYYLSVARLTANKRVDIVVQAFVRMPTRRLVVLSGGPELERLKVLANGANNIEFQGWQTEEALRTWIAGAHAAIYLPVDEDFGMSPVECMAAGKPVIGVAEGGLLETIVHGETGVLMAGSPTPESLMRAVDELETLDPTGMRSACEARAARFDEAVFIQTMKQILGEGESLPGVASSGAATAAPLESTP